MVRQLSTIRNLQWIQEKGIVTLESPLCHFVSYSLRALFRPWRVEQNKNRILSAAQMLAGTVRASRTQVSA